MPNLFLPQLARTLECTAGQTLYEVLADAGLLEGPCGGAGVCGKCRVRLNGSSVLACQSRVDGDGEVLLPQAADMQTIVSTGYQKDVIPVPQEGFGLAVDIGTTTVVAALYDLTTGRELATRSCLNGQARFGQDVISRIQHARRGTGLAQLQALILADLNALISQLLEQEEIAAALLTRIVIAGNTTMIHLLTGQDPSSLASAPYLPAFTGPLHLQGDALGLIVPAAVDCLPAIASYVGGDITAGMVACGIGADGPLTLLLDIGTNGEIVLAGHGALHCCACAAGPALEGMNICCGMRAAPGAIESVSLQGGVLQCSTIGGAVPRGICGSGLLSAISTLLADAVITPSGCFADHPLVTQREDGPCVLLDAAHDLYLSQKDVRQVQLVKGAILSGIYTLLEASGYRESDVVRVIVAGQFGAHLTGAALVGCGLLPQSWVDRLTYAGNTSKSGAALCLLSPQEAQAGERLAQDATYIELSALAGYEAHFLDCLNF